MVYLSDSAGYIPVTPIRSSRHPQAGGPHAPPQLSADYHHPYSGGAPVAVGGGGGGGGGVGSELEQWRPELWDRDYSRRYRQNNTRVQRKWFINCGNKRV